eukprot:scaffold4998_cov120-Isochrysis_galbana.AAC.5
MRSGADEASRWEVGLMSKAPPKALRGEERPSGGLSIKPPSAIAANRCVPAGCLPLVTPGIYAEVSRAARQGRVLRLVSAMETRPAQRSCASQGRRASSSGLRAGASQV